MSIQGDLRCSRVVAAPTTGCCGPRTVLVLILRVVFAGVSQMDSAQPAVSRVPHTSTRPGRYICYVACIGQQHTAIPHNEPPHTNMPNRLDQAHKLTSRCCKQPQGHQWVTASQNPLVLVSYRRQKGGCLTKVLLCNMASQVKSYCVLAQTSSSRNRQGSESPGLPAAVGSGAPPDNTCSQDEAAHMPSSCWHALHIPHVRVASGATRQLCLGWTHVSVKPNSCCPANAR